MYVVYIYGTCCKIYKYPAKQRKLFMLKCAPSASQKFKNIYTHINAYVEIYICVNIACTINYIYIRVQFEYTTLYKHILLVLTTPS